MPEVFGYCDANCKHPVYTKEQTLSILQQMIDGGSLAGINPDDSPVVAMLREEQNGEYISFWLGTEAEFNALAVTAKTIMCRIDENGKMYLCTDDTTFTDHLAYAAEQLAQQTDKALAKAIADVNAIVGGKQAQHLTRTATLTAAGWSSGTQTVEVDGVTADNTVMVAAAAASMESYGNSKVKCTAQADGKLTFTCDTENVPTEALTINISIWGV